MRQNRYYSYIAHTHNDFINTHALLIVTHFSSSLCNVCQHITLTSVGGGQGMEKQLVSCPKQVHNDNNELKAVSPTIDKQNDENLTASSQQNTAKTNETNQQHFRAGNQSEDCMPYVCKSQEYRRRQEHVPIPRFPI